ncbi:MAG: ribbon-helix-helix domain-containing protein [Azoarcus sp.]|jgi:predicted DNA-binding protein|nr:ribbon-helix-helix domain-containing protein [Azoarcus sp.]
MRGATTEVPNKVQVNLRMPKDISDRVDRLAEETGRTKSSIINEAVAAQLGEMEAIRSAARIAEQRFRDEKTKYYSQEEVIARIVEKHPEARELFKAYLPD